jgi:hypothetical protein
MIASPVRVIDEGEWRVDEPWPRCWSGEPRSWVADFWGDAECAYCHRRRTALAMLDPKAGTE